MWAPTALWAMLTQEAQSLDYDFCRYLSQKKTERAESFLKSTEKFRREQKGPKIYSFDDFLLKPF